MSPRWADHYTRKAQAEGYGARSVYKLEEIQRRCRMIPRNGRVLDLGCFPGSWSRYLLEQGVGRLVGVDFKVPEGLTHPAALFLAADARDLVPDDLIQLLGGFADLVVCDMAPNTTGARFSDHVHQLELARLALLIATRILRPGGSFVTKVFDGADAVAFDREVRPHFDAVRRVKPDATRKQSVEFFLVGTGFKRIDVIAPQAG